jgi:hypothetical protein
MRRVGLLILVSVIAAGAVGVAYASQSRSPKAVRSSMLSAARAKHSVRWKQTARYPGDVFTMVTDAGATEGKQTLRLRTGKQLAHLTIKLVDNTVYVEGDEPGLEMIQGLTPSQAQAYAGQWIAIPKGDKDYAQSASALTLSSLVRDFAPRGILHGVKGKRHGVRMIGVKGTHGRGKKRETDVLYARARGKKLPLEQLASVPGRHFSARIFLSRWNEKVAVTAPTAPVPIATVRQS